MTTENLDLKVFPASEWGSTPHRTFVNEVAGETNSNMHIIDKNAGDTKEAIKAIINRLGGNISDEAIEDYAEIAENLDIATTPEEIGALPLTGGTLTGTVNVEYGTYPQIGFKPEAGGLATVEGSSKKISLQTWQDAEDSTNRRYLDVMNATGAEDIADALQLCEHVDNTLRTSYKIYGEHNKPTAEDVGALSLSGGTITNTIYVKPEEDINASMVVESHKYPQYIIKQLDNDRRISLESGPNPTNPYVSLVNRGGKDSLSGATGQSMLTLRSELGALKDTLVLQTRQAGEDTLTNTYRIYGEHNKPTAADVGAVNPNLLDNWYFGNPVNQRGKTQYTGSTYASKIGLDRWWCRLGSTNTGAVKVESDGLVMDITDPQFFAVLQNIEHSEKLCGRTCTASILVTENTINDSKGGARLTVSYQNIGTANVGTTVGYANYDGIGLYSTTFTFPETLAENQCFKFVISAVNSSNGSTATSGHVKVLAAKLELGSAQTLAHEENGVWVLNEIPNYTSELLKCQRYYYALPKEASLEGFYYGNGMCNAYSTFPVPMRVTEPSISWDTTKSYFADVFNGGLTTTTGGMTDALVSWEMIGNIMTYTLDIPTTTSFKRYYAMELALTGTLAFSADL